MSTPRVFLVISLILNAILLAWALLPMGISDATRLHESPAAEAPASGFAAWLARLAPSRDAAAKQADTAPAADYPESGWTQSLYDDVAELRERGFDDATVRMLALAEAERLFRERARAVMAPRRIEYWQADLWGTLRVQPDQLATFQRLRREKVAAIEELVGPDALSTEANTPDTFLVGARVGGRDYLPRDKWLALTEYLEMAGVEQAASADMIERVRRGSGMGYVERMAAREAEIRLILGPQLFDEYTRRSSPAAARLRMELAAFKPTRAEFDALAQIENEHRTRRVEMGAFSAGVGPAKMQAMSGQRNDAIRAALGEQRYVEYGRIRDHAFVQLNTLAKELRLAPDVARASYELVEESRAKMQALAQRRDPGNPQVQRDVQALQSELRNGLVEKLGLQDVSENELAVLLRGVVDLPWSGPQQGAAMVRGQ